MNKFVTNPLVQTIHLFITLFLLIYIIYKSYTFPVEHMTDTSSQQNAEAMQMVASLYNSGKMVVDELEVKNSISVDGSILAKGPIKSTDYVLAGDGSADHTYINSDGVDSRNNNTGKELKLNGRSNGGSISVNGTINCPNINVNDYIGGRRLDITGPNGTTHLNYNNGGLNYYRGSNNIFKEDVRFEKYNGLIVNGSSGCGNRPSEWRLHWGCNASHAFG